MIPLYILGMLLRYGPLHGYQIKKMLMEQMADFTDIKLPTIYYHLEKMEATGLISARNVKDGVRPEKRVYQVSGSGREKFVQLLQSTLEISYRPTFEVDGALFFSDYADPEDFRYALESHISSLLESLERISRHRCEVISGIPEEMRGAAELIFTHHELHYQAELAWTRQAIAALKEDRSHDKTENNGN